MESFKTKLLGREISLSNKCRTIWGASREGKIYEEDLIHKFFNHIDDKERINFFDIGANTGGFIFLPLFNPKIQTFAFEPNPLAYEALIENINLNGLEGNVIPQNVGLWDVSKELELKIPIDTTDSGLATFGENPSRFIYDDKSGEYTTHTIQCKTIDELVNEYNLNRLDLIKIDTEGAELNIIKGGERILKRFKPTILLEYHNENTIQFGYQREEILECLKSYGYTEFKLLTQSDLLAK